MDESKVYLQKSESGELVKASLFDQITADHLKLWDDGWLQAMRIHCAGVKLRDRPEDSHWDWKRKIRLAGNLLSYGRAGSLQRIPLAVQDPARGTLMAPTGRISD